jgi:hypothetical protein
MAFRRHGDPRQTGIEVSELAPFVRVARRVIERNKDRVNWLAVYARWDAMVRVCQAVEAEARTGKPYIRWRRQAANLVVEIASNVEAKRAFELVAALYLYADARPERFITDASFAAEVLHVVRREAKAGRVFTNGRTGSGQTRARTTISYRLMAGRVRDTAARFILNAFGSPSVHLAAAERRRMDEQQRQTNAYFEAMRSIA